MPSDINLPLPGYLAIDWSLLSLALVFVLLRLWIRRTRQGNVSSRALNISDTATVGAWLSGLVLVGINTWKNTLRMKYTGWPEDELYYGVPRSESAHLLMVSWVSLLFIYISLYLSKAAFIAFYYHLFDKMGTWCTCVKAFAAAFTGATFLIHMGFLIFWCSPVDLNWNIDGQLCSAVHSLESVTILTFLNVATDLIIIVLPLVILRQLRIHQAQVYVYIFVLVMGSMSIVAALARYVALKLAWGTGTEITHTIDVWAIVEVVASLLAVCMPSLRLLIRHQREDSRARSSASRRDSRRHTQASSQGGDSGVAVLVSDQERELHPLGWEDSATVLLDRSRHV